MNLDSLIKLLACSQYLSLKQTEDDKYLSKEEREKLDENSSFKDYVFFHRLIYEKLGFDYVPKDLVPKIELFMADSLVDFTYHNTYTHNKIGEKIQEFYGEDLYLLYGFTICFLNMAGICSIAEHFVKHSSPGLSEKNQLRVNNEQKKLIKYFKELEWIFTETELLLQYYEPITIEKMLEIGKFIKNKKRSSELLSQVHSQIVELIPSIIPEYAKIVYRVDKAKAFVRQLKRIEPGIKKWTEYEKLCFKVLNYLFVPPFRKVYEQAKTSDSYERRDAIIPNTAIAGFWGDIKNEFGCKNIVIEFKNLSKGYNKDVLNQLRIYLSKPTIGKFGLLFARGNDMPSSILKAQRDAYEQNGILILIITDKILERLIMAKAYFESCDDFLANEKVRFEISY
jgi:hypothetical protein